MYISIVYTHNAVVEPQAQDQDDHIDDGMMDCYPKGTSPCCMLLSITLVSQVSAQGWLNITCNFGPHGHLPGIQIPYICMEAAIVTP